MILIDNYFDIYNQIEKYNDINGRQIVPLDELKYSNKEFKPILIDNNLVFRMPNLITNRDRQLYNGKIIKRYSLDHFENVSSNDKNNWNYILSLLKIEELFFNKKELVYDILPMNTIVSIPYGQTI